VECPEGRARLSASPRQRKNELGRVGQDGVRCFFIGWVVRRAARTTESIVPRWNECDSDLSVFVARKNWRYGVDQSRADGASSSMSLVDPGIKPALRSSLSAGHRIAGARRTSRHTINSFRVMRRSMYHWDGISSSTRTRQRNDERVVHSRRCERHALRGEDG